MMSSNFNNSILICGACRTELQLGEEYLQCMVVACSKLYHYACNNKTLSTEEKATWACPECTCAAKKGGRNCETPVGTPVNVKNVTLRTVSDDGTKPPAFTFHPREEDLHVSPHLEIQLLREQMTAMTEQLADAVSAIGRYHSALVLCTGKVEAMSRKLVELERAEVPRCPSCTVLSRSFSGAAAAVPGKTIEARDSESHSQGDLRSDAASPPVPPTGSDVIHDDQQGQSESTKPQTDDQSGSTGREWKKVGAGNQKRQISLRCTAGPSVTMLKAVEYRKHIHLRPK